jgi:hypothetical protein
MSKRFIAVRNWVYGLLALMCTISNIKVIYEWNWILARLFGIQVNSQSNAFATASNFTLELEPYLSAVFVGLTITLLTCRLLIDLGEWLAKNVSWLRWIA